MPSLLDRSVPTTGGATPQFQPSGATGTFYREVSASLKRTSEEMKANAELIYTNSFLSESRKGARSIYDANKDNPDQLSKELAKQREGLLSNTPSNLAPELINKHSIISAEYIDKATDAQNEILTGAKLEEVTANQNQIISDMQFTTRNMDFRPDAGLAPEEVADKNLKNLTRFDKILSDFESLDKTYTGIGPNGKPYFDAKAAVKTSIKAREFLGTEVALSWLGSQPDKLAAYGKWLNNEVTITLPEGVVNVRDMMSPETRAKVDKDLINTIKDEVYLSSQQNAAMEEDLERQSEDMKKTMFDRAKSGTLSPAAVRNAKNILDYQDYKDFTQMAIGANPITNGTTYAKIANMISNGEDATETIRVARFTNKDLSNEDFEHFLQANSSKDSSVLPNPIKEGKEYLLGLLGSSSQSLSIANSTVLAKANRDYNGEIQDFITINGRPPVRNEIMKISETINDRYSLIKMDEYAATLEKPTAMPLSMKTKKSELTSENIEAVKKDTAKIFYKKNNNNLDQMNADPEFKRQIKLLDDWTILSKQLEAKAAARANKNK